MKWIDCEPPQQMTKAYAIVYEHSDFIIVYKKPGVSVQGDNASLVTLLRQALNSHEIFPVHRLDKPTSGLLIFALNAQSNVALSKAFEHKSIEKYYLAISAKKPKKKQGYVRGDMERGRASSWKLMRTHDKPALTHFYSCHLSIENQRLFLMKPLTGKTHQLRVALKSLGSPILGDKLYKGQSADRVYLHAFILAFEFAGLPYRFFAWPEQGRHFCSDVFKDTTRSLLNLYYPNETF